MSVCPCTSGKAFNTCCGRFIFSSKADLQRKPAAKTPEQLMRSRFTAYALGNYGDYLLATWWPLTSQHLSSVELSQKSCEWVRLDILEKSQKGNDGWVSFCAWYLDENGSEQAMRERSTFKRENGRWYYVDGDVS
ncbi:YchJ family metal-binding protein [Saccharophagus degradans]|uniref:YchJ family protein n=1 Tax=Saccharophagus degradans TaxID=86304 RepID=UPI002477D5B3|nr:YchJ family metal-binding protein [Saccharophagus degradans]WGO97002.1 YchJ family metal-binding protein [Saccharophagus degradans]